MLEEIDHERKPHILLCHAHEDKERVKELYHQLKEAGYHPWLDKYDLLPGQNWRVEIRKMLSDHNNLVVVCLSGSSVSKRGTVQREIKWALDLLQEMPEGAIYLIPARLERCQVPEQLSDLHWADLFEPDGFEYLVRSLDFEIANRKPPAESEKVKAPDIEISKQPAPPTSARQPFDPELIHIPAGEFLMGSTQEQVEQLIAQGLKKEWVERELPQHSVDLPEYYIAKTPVTNVQYLAFVQATGQEPPEHWKGAKPPAGKEDHPVVYVRWHNAMAYCQWLAETTGKACRLPSEAEWEKAARGTDGQIYPWGDDPPDKNRCNFEMNVGGTTRVGQYSPQGDSPYGCVDMAGNVWEWTSSLCKGYPYDPKVGREDLKAGDDILRVVRGGAFVNNGRSGRCACRYGDLPYSRNWCSGFRLCVAPGFL